jgi:hypothetical protein
MLDNLLSNVITVGNDFLDLREEKFSCKHVCDYYKNYGVTTVCCERRKIVLKILKNRRQSWIRHIIRHNEFVVNILEGAISGKKAVGRPRLQYLKQVARYTGADNYTTMKRMGCNKSRWKAANQSKE